MASGGAVHQATSTMEYIGAEHERKKVQITVKLQIILMHIDEDTCL